MRVPIEEALTERAAVQTNLKGARQGTQPQVNTYADGEFIMDGCVRQSLSARYCCSSEDGNYDAGSD